MLLDQRGTVTFGRTLLFVGVVVAAMILIVVGGPIINTTSGAVLVSIGCLIVVGCVAVLIKASVGMAEPYIFPPFEELI